MTETGRYRCIVADPPWPYGPWGRPGPGASNTTTRGKVWPLPYRAMDVARMRALPVKQLAAEDCELYLWTTQRYLPVGFALMESWGFAYCQTITWCKTPRGRGQGGVYCPTTEFALLGRRGRMPRCQRIDSTWFTWPRGPRHSAKPEAFYDLLETITPAPRIDLFARRLRLGWDVWGDEVQSSVDLAS